MNHGRGALHPEFVVGGEAQRAVEQLEDAEILRRTGDNRRDRVWMAQDVIDALDAFAERIGRRG